MRQYRTSRASSADQDGGTARVRHVRRRRTVHGLGSGLLVTPSARAPRGGVGSAAAQHYCTVCGTKRRGKGNCPRGCTEA